MFCPECKAEYRIGFTRCSDCDVELVEHLVVDTGHDKDALELDYVVIHTTQNQLEADQICSFLRGNGIPVQLTGERFRHPYGIGFAGTGALQILVPKPLARNAMGLIAKADEGDLEIRAKDGDDKTTHTLGSE